MVDHGLSEGAEIITARGPLSDDGLFFAPTIFANVNTEMSIVNEEIFGLVSVAAPFDTTEEVVALANEIQHGLSAEVFSYNIRWLHRVADKLQSENVWVNHFGGVHSSLPFDGFKQSGWGRELGGDGFLAFAKQKSISIQLREN